MIVENLNWDSAFFEKHIASLTVESDDSLDDIAARLEELGKRDIDLVYLFSPIEISLPESGNWIPVDRKRSYLMRHPENKGISPNVEEFGGHPRELYFLGIEAGKYSRFAKDKGFGEAKFKELYETWVRNSVNGSFADYVLTARCGTERCAAFVTAKVKNGQLSVGLLATHPDYRNRGLARNLIDVLETRAYEMGLELEVTTQADNTTACGFYEKCGFDTFDDTFVYHIWLK